MDELSVEVEVDERLPTWGLNVTVDPEGGGPVRVNCSPDVEAEVLALLHPDLALGVADAIDALRSEED